MLYRLDISTFNFYEPLLFQIFVPWKFIKNKSLGLPLSTITFTVNSHVDNYSYKYIYFIQIQYKISFFIKIAFKILNKVFYIQIWFKCGTPLLVFLIRTMVCRQKLFIEKNTFFAVDYIKVIELHIVHMWRHMQSELMKWGM